MKRRHFKRNALCCSDHYGASRRAHADYLQECHSHFSGMIISGEIAIDTPIFRGEDLLPKYKTIRVFGKEMRITVEEYNIHCKPIGY